MGTWVRIPISYTLKLTLADLGGTQPYPPDKMACKRKRKSGVLSRYTDGFGHPVVETDVMVHSALAHPLEVEEP